MEFKNLPTVVLSIVLIGMILGVGILVFNNFGQATREEVATSESLPQAAGVLTTTNSPIKSVSFYGNTTKSNTTFNCVGCAVNYTAATGVFAVENTVFDDGVSYTVNYTYYKNSSSTDVMVSTAAAISPIASTWLSLIVTIIALSIIMVFVIKSFSIRQ